ncbi:hypothetical protein [Hoeflea sp.]|uniref:hypothetical protein n=1 Tax=Hoeflea sp. TaxID=1940281 RepID=UPI003BB07FAD
MVIEISKVVSKPDLQTFMALPTTLYRNFENYVPPLALETKKLLDPDLAPFFKYGEAQYWLAHRDGEVVGRISAQIDSTQPAEAYGNAGLFGCLDVIDDMDVTRALLDTAEEWLRLKGVERAIGPLSMNLNGLGGLLVEGHDLEPMIMVPWHPPYLENHFEQLPYEQCRDLHYWRLEWSSTMSARYAERKKLSRLPNGYEIRNLDFAQFDRDVEIVRGLYNTAWKENWGFVPLQPEDLEGLGAEMKPFLNKEMGIIVERQGKPAAMAVMIPNLSEITADVGPNPSPLGWAKLAYRRFFHQFQSGRVILFGISPDIRHSVGGAVIAISIIEHLVDWLLNLNRKNGVIEAGWVLDNNHPLRNILIQQGFHVSRTLRLYDRPLSSRIEK